MTATPDDRDDTVADGFARLLHDAIGLRVESSLRTRLHRCVKDAAASRGLAPERYLDAVRSGGDELQSLINDITVQESGFFRHPEQFVVLGRDLLPGLGTPLRIWSAGCANGQEAYSLVMLLDELGIAGSVVATDLSTTALDRTAAAHYSTREIAGLSPERRARYLEPDGAGWRVVDALRARVTTTRHNLLDPLPIAVRPAQVIFCRNLLIYLTPDHVRAFLDRVGDAYPPGTPLFLGAAEVLWQTTDRFEVVRVDGTFHYRRRDRPAGTLERTATAHAALPRYVEEPVRPRAPRPAANPVRARAPRPVEVLVRGGPPRPAETPGGAGSSLPAGASSAATSAPVAAAVVDSESDTDVVAVGLERAGQLATAAGDHRAAVVAFRACAYLRPHDAGAFLHLGLALEAAGDLPAALRAYGAARRALAETDPTVGEATAEGYSMTELVRLLDVKLLLVAS